MIKCAAMATWWGCEGQWKAAIRHGYGHLDLDVSIDIDWIGGVVGWAGRWTDWANLGGKLYLAKLNSVKFARSSWRETLQLDGTIGARRWSVAAGWRLHATMNCTSSLTAIFGLPRIYDRQWWRLLVLRWHS
jgi:hypothetical protein